MIKKTLTLLFCICFSFQLYSQELKRKTEKLLEKSQEALVARNWNDALAYMEQAVVNEPENFQVHLEKAYLYYSVRDLSKMIPSLKKAFQLNPSWKAKYHDFYFILGKESFENGAYEFAEGPIDKYIERGFNTDFLEMSKVIKASVSYALEQLAQFQPSKYQIQKIKSDQFFRSVYFPFFTLYPEEELFFTAQRNRSVEEGIYRAKLNGTQFEKIEEVPVINSDENEGAAAISADGRVMVFTSCNKKDSYGSCDLYISYKNGDNWSKPENLGSTVNGSAWESQPYLSSDGRLLIFSSNRIGGVGKRDIYYSVLAKDGVWEVAKNLGAQVNTFADEISPFLNLTADTLYYSTNGRVGMGGFDFFKVPWDLSAVPVNLGLPFNSNTDEISYHQQLDGSIYWAHELKSEEKYPPSEILFIQKSKQSEKLLLAYGKVIDAETKKALTAEIQIYDLQADSLLRQTYSDNESGKYKVLIPEKSEYSFYVEADGYLFESVKVDFAKLVKLEKNFALKLIAKGSSISLNNIFFEFDSDDLNDKSINEINKIAQFLEEHPNVAIEVAGYTDNVGAKTYNLNLSERRAHMVHTALLKKGIGASRLTFRGYGAKPQVDGSFRKTVVINITRY
ncbi:MAG: OOP family OmpA-OmpF porin [Marivirga sp.]|jgi:OOP family OmpA-OmpF porin